MTSAAYDGEDGQARTLGSVFRINGICTSIVLHTERHCGNGPQHRYIKFYASCAEPHKIAVAEALSPMEQNVPVRLADHQVEPFHQMSIRGSQEQTADPTLPMRRPG